MSASHAASRTNEKVGIAHRGRGLRRSSIRSSNALFSLLLAAPFSSSLLSAAALRRPTLSQNGYFHNVPLREPGTTPINRGNRLQLDDVLQLLRTIFDRVIVQAAFAATLQLIDKQSSFMLVHNFEECTR